MRPNTLGQGFSNCGTRTTCGAMTLPGGTLGSGKNCKN